MATILVVDDSDTDRHLVEDLLGEVPGFSAAHAVHGRQALEAIERQPPDLVLTDLQMPGMDGLELVREVRARHPRLPVILITAYGSEELAIRALREGAASYVPKRNLARDLLDTINSVLALASTAKDQQRILGCLTQTESRFLLDNDETLITPLVGYLEADLRRQEFCSSNGLLRLAIALREALINAIHHGNLEVPSEVLEKDQRAYCRLVEERRRQPPYRERRLHVTAKLTSTEATYVIADEGPGFDPSRLPDPTDPTNLGKPGGRGLLLIRTFMDEVSHNAGGNQITMIKRRQRVQ
jgi:CheY-like chemotaxis protein/anti-sigma regulatory factor (Ser/Thr protein kinase)